MPTEPPPTLDPPTQAALLMALLAFLVLGAGMIAGVMIGARWVRRIGKGNRRRSWRPQPHFDQRRDASSYDTCAVRKPSDETVHEVDGRDETAIE